MSTRTVEQVLRKHLAMYGWSRVELRVINDFILTVREGLAEELMVIPPADPMQDSRDPAMNEVRDLQASAAASFFQVEESLPADPTPSAVLAPTGGETVTRYDLCCGEESAWMEPGPTGAYVLFEDVRAALSSPVRAEPIDAGTWRTMYEAWRKRAEEAERELVALQPSAASPLSSPLSPLSPEQRAALADFTATMQNEVIPALVAKRRRAGGRAASDPAPVRAEPTELRISDVDHNLLDDMYLDQLLAWAREQGMKVYAVEAADTERLTFLVGRLAVSPPVRAEPCKWCGQVPCEDPDDCRYSPGLSLITAALMDAGHPEAEDWDESADSVQEYAARLARIIVEALNDAE